MANRRMGVRDLAAATGLDVGTVSDFINGRRWPVLKTLGTIEAALEIPAGTLDNIKKGWRSDGTPMNLLETASGDSGVDPLAVSPAADTVPVIEERQGEVSGRNVVKVRFAALGVEVETTYTDDEDRAAVLHEIMQAVGLGEFDGQGDRDGG
jgi:transcriptional regulator with XRE-family HTH domain